MQTFTDLRTLYGNLTNNSSSANLTLGDTLINIFTRRILNKRQWFFKETSSIITTVASQQFYTFPANYGSLINVTVTISNTTYTPIQVNDRKEWDRLNQSSSVKSDIPEWYFVFEDQVGFYPTPSGGSNTINIYFQKRVVDLLVADFTTGTIATASNASASITGGSTSWTTGMAGKQFKITPTNAAKGGDGRWYEISSIDSTTTLTLTKKYLGTSIATASAAYIIGDTSILPEDFQQLPVWKAVETYFTSIKPQATQATLYKGLFIEGFADLQAQFGSKDSDPVLDIGIVKPSIINPNLLISL